ncbi:MAG: helix-turn-helix domain-containing protein [Verrucomicrobia bacterium]|nr:MAG: helix-turn-helix domain-containing protein [Verrucomicrobiota bacterium]
MKLKHRRVLLALGWYDYRLHRGIERYAQDHGWSLSANLTRERVIPWGWDGDGILAWLGAGDELAEFVVDSKKPTVDFSFRRPHLQFPRVLEDHAHAARVVAEHFLIRGFTHFVYYSDTYNWSYEERGEGFIRALREAGHFCAWLRWQEPSRNARGRELWRRKRQWLMSELKKFPKPVAVFAANDEHALDVVEACQNAGLVVPEQVAIVGAENYLLAPDAMTTPISSVDTNLELLGYSGAELLDQLMHGQRSPREPLRIPAAGIITRKSSDLLAVAHKGVARSLRFIWEHSHEPISVKDLIGVAAMSRRGLHKAFMEHIGRTPGQEIHRVRIERAKKLLAESDHKMEVLAGMCGYQSANSFCVAFKQSTGQSPKQFRDRMNR